MFILPFTGILGAALMFSGVVSHIPCGSYQGGGLSAGRGCSRCGLSDWLLYSAPTADLAFVCACGCPVFMAGKGLWRIALSYIRMVTKGRGKLNMIGE